MIQNICETICNEDGLLLKLKELNCLDQISYKVNNINPKIFVYRKT